MYRVYSKDNCDYCKRAEQLLISKGLSYYVFKLGTDFTREELLERFPNAKTFPQIEVEHGKGHFEYIGGHDDLVKSLAKG